MARHTGRKLGQTTLNKSGRNQASPQAKINAVVERMNAGDWEEAERLATEMSSAYPELSHSWTMLGVVLAQMGRLDEAIGPLQRAAELMPRDAGVQCNLGNAYREAGRLEEAEASCRRAIEINPGYADAHNNLGNALRDLGRVGEAESAYRRATTLNPRFAMAYYNLGLVLNDLGKLKNAEASLRKAIALNPDHVEAHYFLGLVLIDLGRLHEAETSCQKVICLKPGEMEYRYKLALSFPDIYNSTSAIQEWRNRYHSGLLQLLEYRHALVNPAKTVATHTFHLAYHNQSDLDLMKLRSQLVRDKVENARFLSPHVLDWLKPDNRKIRIGFCSQFLVEHTIGVLYQGLIKQLDRSIFEVILIHASETKKDQFSNDLDRAVDKVLQLGPVMSEQLDLVSREKLDILFYPDIGMYPETYYLAHARLAPVQVVSWGHPDTTGIDTLDYFVSSSLIEPDNADQQYSERLIRLNRLPCYYEPILAPTEWPDRMSMMLPEKATLYGCPQSLFKLHPDFDAVLSEIVEKDPKGRIVLVEGRSPAWSALLRERWARNHPILNEKVLFLPMQPWDRFMALMAHMDVLLDPIHFGSGNTMYESKFHGTPTVTWQGQFMRGRIVAGAYRQMGVQNAPIVSKIDEYAALAVDLGMNPDKRDDIRQEILNAVDGCLHSDLQVVREFEEFFVAAIDAADKGEKLPMGWMPSGTNRSTY
ncbi:tetratricopeptide repeat protein [Mariprofundus ferrooxydans]|uniref:O-linked N-acetylglucosamine transferase, SPINDLY family protein n=1 Tax=Mariprofundus ferrooxydans TaxID=314344 RepID=UPI00142F77DC|nr:tetratricopeptide repeat protein [Mariprofundus ferrooxydans]